MLHGSPSDHARAMAQVEPAFRRRKGWQRIYPDLPGHGNSQGIDRIHDMDDYLCVLIEFADKIADGGRFSVGGISFGAYLALGIAHKRASRIDGLLLSVPEVNHSPLEERRDRAHGTPSIQTPRALSRSLPKYREDTTWLYSLPFQDVSLDLYQFPRPVASPTLFLFGRQDAPFRYRTYWRVLKDFPRATYAILDGAGHGLWNDRNELVCGLVRDWLDRVEKWSLTKSRRLR